MSQFEYKPRIADAVLEKKIKSSGAVLIEGPKWCGKTTTAEQHSKSVNYVSDPVNLNKNMILAEMNINTLLEGEKPKLLDEWQIIPQLWDAVRFAVDHSKGIGQFIMTGSAVPLDQDKQSKIHHTGTGRITSLRMRPMSLWESGDSNGEVSLATLFQNPGTQIYREGQGTGTLTLFVSSTNVSSCQPLRKPMACKSILGYSANNLSRELFKSMQGVMDCSKFP